MLRFSRHPFHLAFCLVILLPALVSVLLGAPSARADLESGKAAYLRDDHAIAYKELRPLAEAGNAEAQYFLSNVLRIAAGVSGRGVENDRAESDRMLRLAAKQDHAGALERLGQDYHWSNDYARAFEYSLRAARVDGESGTWTIAFMYCFGEGVPRDSLESDAWKSFDRGPFRHDVEAWEGVQCETTIRVTPEYILRVNRRAAEIRKEYGLPVDF